MIVIGIITKKKKSFNDGETILFVSVPLSDSNVAHIFISTLVVSFADWKKLADRWLCIAPISLAGDVFKIFGIEFLEL